MAGIDLRPVGDYFVCLTMLVSSRHYFNGDTLTALDMLAHAIEREPEGPISAQAMVDRIFPARLL